MNVLVACDVHVACGKVAHFMCCMCVGGVHVRGGNSGSSVPIAYHACELSIGVFNYTISCGVVSTCCLKDNVVCEQEFLKIVRAEQFTTFVCAE